MKNTINLGVKREKYGTDHQSLISHVWLRKKTCRLPMKITLLKISTAT